MAKCIVMNIENSKNQTFDVCVNGDKPPEKDCVTDVEIELDEKFIHALENAVIDTMVPDPSKKTILGEVYRIPKKEYRYRVVRLEPKHKTELKEGVSPNAVPVEHLNKPRGNPNWRKKHIVPVEAEQQLTEV